MASGAVEEVHACSSEGFPVDAPGAHTRKAALRDPLRQLQGWWQTHGQEARIAMFIMQHAVGAPLLTCSRGAFGCGPYCGHSTREPTSTDVRLGRSRGQQRPCQPVHSHAVGIAGGRGFAYGRGSLSISAGHMRFRQFTVCIRSPSYIGLSEDQVITIYEIVAGRVCRIAGTEARLWPKLLLTGIFFDWRTLVQWVLQALRIGEASNPGPACPGCSNALETQHACRGAVCIYCEQALGGGRSAACSACNVFLCDAYAWRQPCRQSLRSPVQHLAMDRHQSPQLWRRQ